MNHPIDIAKLLQPLFDAFEAKFNPAAEKLLKLFATRAKTRGVPGDVISQLQAFYSITDGVPCLDSLSVHRCDDMTIFEWWKYEELWLGQRDYKSLRWSRAKNAFCIGDGGNVSFGASDEFPLFAEALRRLVKAYDAPATE